MKKRGSVLLCLKEQVEIRDKSLVIELENEILDFFNKFDLFYHYNVNSRMMKLINTKTYKTYDQIAEELEKAEAKIFEKPVFGSEQMAEYLYELAQKEELKIELIGLCTDICVVSNALLLKAKLPETELTVNAKCCAGVTPESHEAALLTMKMCQIDVIRINL